MEEIKRRIWMNVCVMGMILIVIIYSLLLLLFMPVMIIGSFVWGWQTFYKVSGQFMDHVPDIPDIARGRVLEKDKD